MVLVHCFAIAWMVCGPCTGMYVFDCNASAPPECGTIMMSRAAAGRADACMYARRQPCAPAGVILLGSYALCCFGVGRGRCLAGKSLEAVWQATSSGSVYCASGLEFSV